MSLSVLIFSLLASTLQAAAVTDSECQCAYGVTLEGDQIDTDTDFCWEIFEGILK